MTSFRHGRAAPRLAALMGGLFAAALAAANPAAAASLFEDLGGKEGIARIVNDGVDRVLADARIKGRFANTDAKRLKGQLAEQFCQISGGPCVYGGRSMEQAHAGLNLRNAEFNALAEDFQTAMEQQNIPFTVQNRLIGLLAPMQRTVVGQ